MVLRIPKEDERLAGRSSRGFTLAELMIVVVIMGILATIGISSYQKHKDRTKLTQALATCRSIGVAQEAYKSLNGEYLDVSTDLSTYYPDSAPNRAKVRWEWGIATHPDEANWTILRPKIPAAIYYRYATVAGLPGQPWPVVGASTPITWPTGNVDPWYVIQAVSDLDGDGDTGLIIMASFNDHIYLEDDGE